MRSTRVGWASRASSAMPDLTAAAAASGVTDEDAVTEYRCYTPRLVTASRRVFFGE